MYSENTLQLLWQELRCMQQVPWGYSENTLQLLWQELPCMQQLPWGYSEITLQLLWQELPCMQQLRLRVLWEYSSATACGRSFHACNSCLWGYSEITLQLLWQELPCMQQLPLRVPREYSAATVTGASMHAAAAFEGTQRILCSYCDRGFRACSSCLWGYPENTLQLLWQELPCMQKLPLRVLWEYSAATVTGASVHAAAAFEGTQRILCSYCDRSFRACRSCLWGYSENTLQLLWQGLPCMQ